ncbi:SGNH/GDSL hydrolase family protein [Paenibacillus sp. PL2-23]|uniref:SGNH/GDSL hydrolase family protein n=1 Tax=Paenibacillus sp. PL2-23 TaxID=2100729 RepID=UPI0030FBD4A2
MNQTCFINALEVLDTEEGWQPVRFSPHQLEAFSDHDMFQIRSLCNAGIALDFYTDASYVQFQYVVKEWVRDYLAFDIYVDNIFVDQVYTASNESGEHTFIYEMSQPEVSKQERRITIYLPHNVQTTYREFILSDGATWRVAESPEKRLLCLGDSITQGMDAVNPSLTYPVMLARQLNMGLLNQGVGGHIFDEGTIDPHLSYRPHLITVAYGTNDWIRYQQLSELEKACEAYLHRLHEVFPHTPIFVVTPIWRVDGGTARPSGTFEEVSSAIRSIASRMPNTVVINGLELVPHLPAMYADLVHPTNEGFVHMAMNLAKRIHQHHNKEEV